MKRCYHNHTKSFCNKRYTNDKSLSKYICEIKEKPQENPCWKWSTIKRVPAYSNITKKRLLCLHEKLEIVDYPHPEELLFKRSELVSRRWHPKNYLLNNYKANELYINIPVEFLKFYLSINLMLNWYF